MFAAFDKYLKDHDYVLTEKEFKLCKSMGIIITFDRSHNGYDHYTATADNGKIWSFLVEVQNAA